MNTEIGIVQKVGARAFVPAESWPEMREKAESLMRKALEHQRCRHIRIMDPEKQELPDGWELYAYGERLV